MWGATAIILHSTMLIMISIHAPRVGRDTPSSFARAVQWLFQSTRPVWGATLIDLIFASYRAISIHAPRVGRDATRVWRPFCMRDFNPRAPCGARLKHERESAGNYAFQSTRPVWGATIMSTMVFAAAPISIHAPRVGRDDRPL